MMFLEFFYFSLSCLCSEGKSSTNLWLAEPHTKLVQTLIDSVLFFFLFSYQMSIVSDECIYFWSCLNLCKELAQCVRLRWRQDHLLFWFVLRFSS